ncbi:hypothetical protein RB195_012343 [Necator americanus]|uniref:7TM GPCR serpentine receptor class x (Srx) domain-containing protein n=1 Tax=Necator americanus TaxID=51031 RepID=A0ABR1D7C6_NECAM
MTELTGASKEYLNIHETYHVILGINTAVVSAVLLVLNIITLNPGENELQPAAKRHGGAGGHRRGGTTARSTKTKKLSEASEDHFSIVALLVCFTLCYADIFHKIFSQNSRNSLERRLTINIFIYGLYYTCIFIYWEFIDEKLEDNPVTNFFSNMMWVVANGLQAILTLILNSAVRKAGTKFMLPSTAGLDKCRQIRLRSLIEAVFKKPSSVVAHTTITVIVSKKAVVAAT